MGLRKLRAALRLAAALLTVGAVVNELVKPEEDRTWEGELLGFVPYSFLPPTLDRIKRSYWNADDPRLFTGRVFGVGWAVNLYRVRELLLRGYSSLTG